jgi:predicted deacylase
MGDATKLAGMSEGSSLPNGYRALSEVRRAIDAVGKPFVYGRSVRGDELFGTAIGSGADHVLVVAGVHAQEWIGVETALHLLDGLAPPDDRTVLVVPVANPDGYLDVENDLRAGRIRWRRANARGVDLNRNFPTHFRRWRIGSILPRAIDIWAPGDAPRSEPEVDALLSLLESRGKIVRTLSLHSFGAKVLHPYCGKWKPPRDRRAHDAALEIAQRTGYHAVQGSHWVPGAFAYGTELDHFHEAFGAVSLLVECSRGGIRLRSPSSLFQPFRWFNPPDPARETNALRDALLAYIHA